MKWKNRLTNYNFWISIVSAVLLILQAFNINFDIAYINEIATAVLGLLVVIGIINDPTKSTVQATDKLETNNYTQTKEQKQIQVEEEIVEEKSEKKLAEENVIPSNIKNEDDSSNSENDFKAIIEAFSADIKNKLEEVIAKTNDKENKANVVAEKTLLSEEQSVEEDIEFKSQPEQNFYNIVN